jgi:hypothetical protein
MKQTAVEWLSDNLWFLEEQIANKEITLGQYAVTRVELLEQAKEMEKEQTLKFGIKCQLDFIKSDGIRSVEDLYESTFNQQTK